MEEALVRYETALASEPDAQDVILGRGITEEAARTHRLGVVREPHPEHIGKEGWLAIPYLGHDGKPVQIRFRCLEDHRCKDIEFHSKYKSLEGDPSRMYNVQAIIRPGDEIHVAEGELDAIVLNQLGYPAVAIPGAQSYLPHHRRMLAGFSRIYVWGDPDESGAKLATAMTRSLGQAVSVRLEVGDVNETYLALGETGIHDALLALA